MEISVVIPTYRRHDALTRTTAALAGQSLTADAFEDIVVDDPVMVLRHPKSADISLTARRA